MKISTAVPCLRGMLPRSRPLLLSALVACVLLPAARVRAQIPPSYTLAFDDEFNASTVDTTAWMYRTDAKDYSQQEAANVTESGGYLHIAVKQQTVGSYTYTGGGLISTTGRSYGYYEARVKSPVGSGWHSSFWAMGFASNYSTSNAVQELDFMEDDSGNTTGYASHYHNWPTSQTWNSSTIPVANPLQSNFNVIGCLYTPTGVTYYLNGVQTWKFDNSSLSGNSANIWLTSIATVLPDATKLPSEMTVDWVHYYAPSAAGSAPAAPNNVSAVLGTNQVALTWEASLGTAITYHVKRSAYSGGPYATVGSGISGTTYTDTGLTAGTQYYYIVTASNSVPVESAASAELSAVTGSTILDDAAASGVTISGTWTSTTFAPGYYLSDYLQDGNTGTGKSVTFTPTLATAGKYVVYARWTAGANRASNVPVDIVSTAGTTTLSVNQQINNAVWVPLGVFNFNAGTGGSVKIRNDGANGFVIADAVMWVPQVPVVMTVSAPSGTTEVGTWTASTGVAGYIGAYDLFDSGHGTGAQSFTFTPVVPATGSYKVYALWTTSSNRATNAPIDIFDGTSTTTVSVNQQLNNGSWVLLGTFSLAAGNGSYVKIRDNGANGYVIADGLMWVPQ